MFTYATQVLVFISCGLIASDESHVSQSQKKLTEKQIQLSKKLQAEARAKEPKTCKIGTFASACSQLDQEIVYQQATYRNVELKEFFVHYDDVVCSAKSEVQNNCMVQLHINQLVLNALEKNGDQRIIDTYEIVGEMPTIETDDNGFPGLDRLFYVEDAQNKALDLMKRFIDQNYERVYEKCHPKIEEESKDVLRVACCSLQFHKTCLQRCKLYKVNCCPNLSCQKAENGTCFSKTWDDFFYRQTLESKALERNEIATDTCVLCENNLRQNLQACLEEPRASKRKIAFSSRPKKHKDKN